MASVNRGKRDRNKGKEINTTIAIKHLKRHKIKCIPYASN